MICILHKIKLEGLFYKLYQPTFFQYGIKTFEVHRCIKCNKEVIFEKEEFHNDKKNKHIEVIEHLELCGVRNYYKYKTKGIR